MGSYKVVPQRGMADDVPIPMHSYSPSLKSSYSTYRTDSNDYSGYDSAQVPLTDTPHRLLLREDDLKLKIRIRVLRIVVRFAATCIAIATATQEGLTLFNYLHTRNHIVNGRGPWALKTELWTSILLFSASVVTVILGIIMIAAYLISFRAANQVSSVQTYFAVAMELAHIGLWIAVAITYRMGKNGHDLWGWACSDTADEIQQNFEGVVNFDMVCNRGENTWLLSIASAGVQILAGVIWYLVYRRWKTKKSLKNFEESRL